MSFNKFYPDRVAPVTDPQALARARVLRYLWIVSTLMLVAGYVLAAMALTGRI